jgi:hypothetical protein
MHLKYKKIKLSLINLIITNGPNENNHLPLIINQLIICQK